MTPTQMFLAAIFTSIMTSGAWPVLGPKVVGWKNRKKNKEDREQDREDRRLEIERDEWLRDAKDAYQRVERDCEKCHTELEKVKERHEREMGTLRRELGEVKDALLDRIEALDEILPYITNLPDDKLRELRAANRAHRQAVFRGKL